MVSVQIAALVLALSNVGETVLLDFQASWCAPCRSMETTVADLEQAGYPIRRVDTDRDRGLATQYHVQSIPCFVLLVDGREAGRLTGAVRRGELLELFAKAGVGPRGGTTEIARGQSPDTPKRNTVLPASLERNPFSPARGAGADVVVAPRDARPARGASPQSLILTNVRLTVADPQGYSYGSGTLIDARRGEALVLSCAHIFRDSKGKGQISVDLSGTQAPQKLPGRLVACDLENDVALVSITPGVVVSVAPVAPQGTRLAKGDRVVTVGCNNGGPPTAVESNITSVGKFLGPANVQVAGLPVQGRSGGGLFNVDGLVIGVCNAADPADNEGLYAALSVIHEHLDRAGLTAVYQRGPARGGAAALAAADLPGRGQQIPAKLQGRQPADALAGSDGGDPLASLNPAQRQELAAAQQRGEGAEVICIVRPLSDPRAKSEVIKLDRASAEFLRQLLADQEAQQARHLTTLHVHGRADASPSRLPVRDASSAPFKGSRAVR